MDGRVLIVDDNAAIHADFRKILHAAGPDDPDREFREHARVLFGATEPARSASLRLDFALQGQEAALRVREAREAGDPFALAFVDMRMPPGWDGLQTIEAIWACDPAVQIVICSAYADQSWDRIVARLGATDRLLVIGKPFEPIEVRQAAAALVHKWTLAREAQRHLTELEDRVQLRTREYEQQNTLLREALLTLQRTQGQLVRAEKLSAVGVLAAGIAHEINTPAQFVGDNLRFLEDAFGSLGEAHAAYGKLLAAARAHDALREQVAQVEATEQAIDAEFLWIEIPLALEQSSAGMQRVSTIVRSMREFSSPSSELMELADLNHAIQNTVVVARGQWQPVAEIELDLDPALPPVLCRVSDISQVVLGLVVNAAQALSDQERPDGSTPGRIRIRTRCDPDWLELRVEDDGPGIPDAIRGRIFDPFFTTKPVGEGTGQGLAMAYQVVVEGHGGTLELDAQVSAGAAFVVRLPLRPAAADAQRAAALS